MLEISRVADHVTERNEVQVKLFSIFNSYNQTLPMAALHKIKQCRHVWARHKFANNLPPISLTFDPDKVMILTYVGWMTHPPQYYPEETEDLACSSCCSPRYIHCSPSHLLYSVPSQCDT